MLLCIMELPNFALSALIQSSNLLRQNYFECLDLIVTCIRDQFENPPEMKVEFCVFPVVILTFFALIPETQVWQKAKSLDES